MNDTLFKAAIGLGVIVVIACVCGIFSVLFNLPNDSDWVMHREDPVCERPWIVSTNTGNYYCQRVRDAGAEKCYRTSWYRDNSRTRSVLEEIEDHSYEQILFGGNLVRIGRIKKECPQ